jgi:hypothetical protein
MNSEERGINSSELADKSALLSAGSCIPIVIQLVVQVVLVLSIVGKVGVPLKALK